jgi:hypothetical protein
VSYFLVVIGVCDALNLQARDSVEVAWVTETDTRVIAEASTHWTVKRDPHAGLTAVSPRSTAASAIRAS